MNTKTPQLLLVEDNPADADLVEEALAEAQLNCDLSIVRDGMQAIEYIESLDADVSRRVPDLVLLDLNLPKIRGEQVLNRLRSSPKFQAAKVLVISSSNEPTDRESSIKLGADEYFRKPSSLQQFMKLGPIVRTLLEGTR
jgi:CheY-like chemotaxis protein